jgi:hypothetical protein
LESPPEVDELPVFDGVEAGGAVALMAAHLLILYFFLQIGSHASLGPLSNLQAVTQVPKLPKKCKKDEIFGSNAEILGVSRKNSAAAEMSNR